MVPHRSLDDSKSVIAALLKDVHVTHEGVFNYSSFRKTLKKVVRRLHAEGEGFLTKSLPSLGKALDRALTGEKPLIAAEVQFLSQKGSELPLFMGEFFNEVFEPTGFLRQQPCVESIRVLRNVLYSFYKYELPYTAEQEQQVIASFTKTEDDLVTVDRELICLRLTVETLEKDLEEILGPFRLKREFAQKSQLPAVSKLMIVLEARRLLRKLFEHFDPTDILPRHGPGAVATKQKLWDKYLWKNVCRRITDMYPFDEYFMSSAGAVCDRYRDFDRVTELDLPAQVILVPKDSRGPRLISCEPVDFQWVQQGLGRALVELLESHPITKWNVNFTNQEPNQFGALLGSITGTYATLDLKEASDRVSLELVRLLFPPRLCEYLEACRSSATTLPDGSVLKLRKFAPMGSCLCFPIMATTIWAILTAAATDEETRERILVYGDDVIVTTKFAVDAIEHLESFGLKVNRDKSCTSGFFRESCGVDAFKGVDVTPIRLRTVWSSHPSAEVYTSWIAYANSFYDRSYRNTYDLIVGNLHHIYGCIPEKSMNLSCPSLIAVADEYRPKMVRTNRNLQKREWRVRDIKARTVRHVLDGWDMLLRYFTEAKRGQSKTPTEQKAFGGFEPLEEPFSVSSYTQRRASKLVWRWRCKWWTRAK